MKRLLPLALMIFSTLALAQERTVERVPREFRMRNQCSTSTCWMHSALQLMDQMADTPLSIDAILIPEIESRALDRYLGYDTPWDGGAGPTRPFALALEHGLVPEAIWSKDSVVVENYHAIFTKIEKLLKQNFDKEKFLAEVKKVIRSYTGDLPPHEFDWQGKHWTAEEYARAIIGQGDSMGYDFRDVQYDDSRYGRMSEVPWTTIMSPGGELTKITDVIKKRVVRTTGEEAWAKAIEIFESHRPLAFTLIWANQDGRTVLTVNAKKEYEAILPATVGFYQSSHLVLISGLIREGGKVVALEALDPAARDIQSGYRVITKEFFMTHGKTVHEISDAAEACAASVTNP